MMGKALGIGALGALLLFGCSDDSSAENGSQAGAGGASGSASGGTAGGGAAGSGGSGGSGATDAAPPSAPCEPGSLFVDPAGDDGNPCNAQAPCATFARAYEVAAEGDTITVRTGQYPGQVVAGGSKAVAFCAELGAIVETLDNQASNVTYDGLEVDAKFAKLLAFHNSGDGVTFRNGRIGNVTDEKGALVSGANFTFENVEFHDVRVTDELVHNECIYAIVVPGFTIRRSRFRACATMDLFFTHGLWWDPVPPPYGDVTIENNVFAHSTMIEPDSWHYYSLYVGHVGPSQDDPLTNWVVRNNTFEIPAAVDTPAVDSRWVGNLGAWPCLDGVAYSHNTGQACDPSDKEVTPAASSKGNPAPFGWKDPDNHDFSLTAGSPAIDAADPNDFPAVDIDGKPRPMGAAPDCGAHEY